MTIAPSLAVTNGIGQLLSPYPSVANPPCSPPGTQYSALRAHTRSSPSAGGRGFGGVPQLHTGRAGKKTVGTQKVSSRNEAAGAWRSASNLDTLSRLHLDWPSHRVPEPTSGLRG